MLSPHPLITQQRPDSSCLLLRHTIREYDFDLDDEISFLRRRTLADREAFAVDCLFVGRRERFSSAGERRIGEIEFDGAAVESLKGSSKGRRRSRAGECVDEWNLDRVDEVVPVSHERRIRFHLGRNYENDISKSSVLRIQYQLKTSSSREEVLTADSPPAPGYLIFVPSLNPALMLTETTESPPPLARAIFIFFVVPL